MKKILFLVFVLGFLNVKSQCDTTLSISVAPTQSGGTATWAAVSGAVTYSWAVLPGSGSNVSIISGATTSTIVSFSGLNASTAYRFQVVTVCSGSTSQPKRSPFSTTTARVVYTPMTAAGYQYKYFKVDSLLHVSAGDTTIARGDTRAGAIVYKNSDSLFYGWNGFKWNNLGSSTTSLVNQINNKVDTIFYNTDTIFYRKNSVTYGIVLNLVPNIRAIVAGYGLAGGGDLSADRSFIVDSTVIASKAFVDAGLATKQNTLTNPITGTGVSGRVPFYTGTNTLSSDTGFRWDNTNKRFGINITPLDRVHIGGNKINSILAPEFTGLAVSDMNSAGLGCGGGIIFRGNHSGTTFSTTTGAIQSFKENATQGDISFAMTFHTRLNGTSQWPERVRITSDGNLLVNTSTNAGFRADINGTARIVGKLTQPTTANSPKGTATLVNGVVTISNTLATTGCFIQVNYRTATAVTGTSSILTVSSLVNATSFTVTAYTPGAATTNTSDNNTIEYTISN